jgi:hypothetical protein
VDHKNETDFFFLLHFFINLDFKSTTAVHDDGAAGSILGSPARNSKHLHKTYSSTSQTTAVQRGREPAGKSTATSER